MPTKPFIAAAVAAVVILLPGQAQAEELCSTSPVDTDQTAAAISMPGSEACEPAPEPEPQPELIGAPAARSELYASVRTRQSRVRRLRQRLVRRTVTFRVRVQAAVAAARNVRVCFRLASVGLYRSSNVRLTVRRGRACTSIPRLGVGQVSQITVRALMRGRNRARSYVVVSADNAPVTSAAPA